VAAPTRALRGALDLGARLRSPDGRPLAERGPLPLGPSIDVAGIRGYYIDFRVKTDEARWPPPWFPWPGFHRFMAIAQWGLGAYERYLLGQGEAWLAAATATARYIVDEQRLDGRLRGGWPEPRAYTHTFRTGSGWLSGMAQGQCASLLVRVGLETGDDRFLEVARTGLEPMRLSTKQGGVRAHLGGGTFFEEYPTDPPSFVLNGGIFALWGVYDVWRALEDDGAGQLFAEACDTSCEHIVRWDTGFWSRYDLYPHPIVNVASPSYHTLHIDQLTALDALYPSAPLQAAARRFSAYAASPVRRMRALAHKVAFRMVVRKGARRA
jgi:heparosan-N-sulfate-glucuronate 5-epimerase